MAKKTHEDTVVKPEINDFSKNAIGAVENPETGEVSFVIIKYDPDTLKAGEVTVHARKAMDWHEAAEIFHVLSVQEEILA